MSTNSRQLAERIQNPFSAPTTSENQTAGAGMLQSQAAAAIQGAVLMAKRFPRDPSQAMNRIIDACTRVKLAEVAEYAYPRGGETVTGPSIRLAETIAQQWGNIDFGIVELSQEGGRSQMMAYAWDLETNTRQQKIFMTEHLRVTRKGSTVLTDPRDVYELTANQGARRVRACILGIIPGDVVEAAIQQCHVTLKNSMAAPEEEINKMVEAFKSFGVSEAAIKKRLGKSFKAVTYAEVIRMRSIYASIKDGMSKPVDWFDLEAGPDDDPTQPPAGDPKKTDAIKDRLRSQDSPSVPPTSGAPVDSNGEVFDAQQHAVNDQDEPIYNKDGSFRKRTSKRTDQAEDAGKIGDDLDRKPDSETLI